MAQIGNIYTDANGTEYTKHPVARVSKVKDDAHLYDLVDTANAIDQGANLVPGDHVDGELQLRVATTPAIGDAIVFVCDVPLIYKDGNKLDQAEWQFVNKKGKRTKAYEVGKDDVLGVSDYLPHLLMMERHLLLVTLLLLTVLELGLNSLLLLQKIH